MRKYLTGSITKLIFSTLFLVFGSSVLYAQISTATVKGQIISAQGEPMKDVSIKLLGKHQGAFSGDSGYFSFQVPANRPVGLLFSHTGYKDLQQNYSLKAGEIRSVLIMLEKSASTLDEVIIRNNQDRQQAGLVQLDPKQAIIAPSATGGIESLIKILVGSNNELTSQYAVRGGNYDENLLYINDFEMYRPYLVRRGQQEGLSFINPALTRQVQFYNGGFQAKYGDRMSSVLDIKYKKPVSAGGSGYISLLEQGLHIEGISTNNNINWLIGARNRINRNLLSSQETTGNYIPSSADLQGLINWDINKRWELATLVILTGSSFHLTPGYSKQSTAVFSPYYTSNLGLDIYFDGKEHDKYSTTMMGFSATNQLRTNLQLKWNAAFFANKESEGIDIQGEYIFGERSTEQNASDFGTITTPLGSGMHHQYARNNLTLKAFTAGHKGNLTLPENYIQWGITADRYQIADNLNEWELQDSAGYTLPYHPGTLQMNNVRFAASNFSYTRIAGFIQNNYIASDTSKFNLQAGLRFNYNGFNKELLISPRIQAAFLPDWKRDIIFRIAAGAYHQPALYRELRAYNGQINPGLKAQKSWQFTGGMDYQFQWNNRPFKFTTELYYKHLYDVVSYDIDNVRIRYSGENDAKAYAAGIEMRLFGELVKDAESWLSIGVMRTRENLHNDYYYNYTVNAANQPTDSVLVEGGWFRRPTDRLITIGLFYQDYLSTNKNFKVHISSIYGSDMPFNLPNNKKYRNALIIDPYIRFDIGFSALLFDPKTTWFREKSPVRKLASIWASLEVFNLIDRPNTISYELIKDYENNIFALPNKLTPRLLNFKIVVSW